MALQGELGRDAAVTSTMGHELAATRQTGGFGS